MTARCLVSKVLNGLLVMGMSWLVLWLMTSSLSAAESSSGDHGIISPLSTRPFSPAGEKVADRPDEGAFLADSELKKSPLTLTLSPAGERGQQDGRRFCVVIDVSRLINPRPHHQEIDIPRSPETAIHAARRITNLLSTRPFSPAGEKVADRPDEGAFLADSKRQKSPLTLALSHAGERGQKDGRRFCAVIDETQSSTAPRIEDTAELEANVGMMAAVKGVVLPGTELTVRKVDPRSSAIMLRIDNVYPHGDGFRYDLTWMAYESGPHNLMEYLVRKDGSEMASLPALNVTAVSVLKNEGSQLNPLQTERNATAGGYRTTLMVSGLLWLIGLGFLISRGWQNRSKKTTTAEDTPVTRLQQIETQLLAAVSQPESLSPAAKAKLESLIVAFWRDEKQLSHHDPSVAISRLRQDPDAGPLLAVLERWLYDRPERSHLDGKALLAPFRRYAEQQQQASGLLNSVSESKPADSTTAATTVASGASGHG